MEDPQSPIDTRVVDLIFQSVNLMLPVLTAYLTVFAAALAKILFTKRKFEFDDYAYSATVFAAGILAISFWAGALAFGIKQAAGGDSTVFQIIPVNQETSLRWARYCVACGYSSFIVTLLVSVVYFFRVAKKASKPGSTFWAQVE